MADTFVFIYLILNIDIYMMLYDKSTMILIKRNTKWQTEIFIHNEKFYKRNDTHDYIQENTGLFIQ